MSKNLEIVLNSAGINELLHSEEISAQLMSIGQETEARAGDNFAATISQMPTRTVCRVAAINKDGVLENSRDNTLLKALWGG